MANRWLKVEAATPDKPEIAHMAQLLSVSDGEVFLAFFRLYAWLDTITDDGFVQFLSPSLVDKRSGLAGFGKAMEDIGWISYSAKGATVSKWDRHNGESAKKRALKAERQRRWRVNGVDAPPSTSVDAVVDAPPYPREEKRREEERR